jgi:hypothetical protein
MASNIRGAAEFKGLAFAAGRRLGFKTHVVADAGRQGGAGAMLLIVKV